MGVLSYSRAQHPNSLGVATARSLTQIITYDAYQKAEVFLTQPLLAIAGSVAGSKWMSEDLVNRAASMVKSLYIVEGSNHMELYDVTDYVAEATHQLNEFFSVHLM